MYRHALKITLGMATWVPVVMTFNQTVGYISWVEGRSMQPALNPDKSMGWRDLVFLQKFGQRNPGALHVGDIIMLRSPTDPEKVLVKRVLGVGGDVINPLPTYPKKSCTIPPNHLWIEGDNSSQSVDSNTFGPVSLGLVLGRATTILFPLSRIGTVDTTGGREARAMTTNDKSE